MELISSIFEAIKIGLQSITGILQIIGINITETELATLLIIVFVLLVMFVTIKKKAK